MNRRIVSIIISAVFGSAVFADEAITLKYAHMNPSASIAGVQAQLLADIVYKKSKGKIQIKVYPASQLGNLKEMIRMVSKGDVAIHLTTMAGLGEVYDGFSVFDTPYLYRDFNHFMKAASSESALVQKFNNEIIKTRNLRIFYTYYFGTRHLTTNKMVKKPSDLLGVKIRAIPYPVYTAAVEGLGAVPVSLDFAETYSALSNGIVAGQENPVDTVYSAKLYEVQKYLVLTQHITGMEAVIFNEKIWNTIPENLQKILNESADEVSRKATAMTLESEKDFIKKLQNAGMTVIDKKNGLMLDEFRINTQKVMTSRFGSKYSDYYSYIEKIK